MRSLIMIQVFLMGTLTKERAIQVRIILGMIHRSLDDLCEPEHLPQGLLQAKMHAPQVFGA
jgi:hypothetical protein